MRESLQNLLMSLADRVTARIPQPTPSQSALRRCKLVSHRGEHDNVTVHENTLAAFRRARDAGVWGIECDIRWTADRVPVVIHDPCGSRVFGDDSAVAALEFEALRERMPLVPSLAELVAEFGGDTHLMLEIKAEPYPDPAIQKAHLESVLAPLQPVRDFHILALDTALFRHVDFLPPAALLPVAELNVSPLSRQAMEDGYGGLTGHYLLINRAVKRRHAAAGQAVGTGHIGSRNALFRELNRGVEWIFSNDALAMKRIRDRLLD